MEISSNLPAQVDADVLHAMNAAAQLLNAAGDPYWQVAKTTLEVGTLAYEFKLDGHRVKSVCLEHTRRLLLRVHSIRQLYEYHDLYIGGDESPDAAYEVRAYYIEAESGDTGHIVKLHFGPRPLGEEQSVEVRYVPRFTGWTQNDVKSGTKTPDIPYDYVELLFLPVARYYVTRSHWFSGDKDLLPRLEADFAGAAQALQQANPMLAIPSSDQLKSKPANKKERASVA